MTDSYETVFIKAFKKKVEELSGDEIAKKAADFMMEFYGYLLPEPAGRVKDFSISVMVGNKRVNEKVSIYHLVKNKDTERLLVMADKWPGVSEDTIESFTEQCYDILSYAEDEVRKAGFTEEGFRNEYLEWAKNTVHTDANDIGKVISNTLAEMMGAEKPYDEVEEEKDGLKWKRYIPKY